MCKVFKNCLKFYVPGILKLPSCCAEPAATPLAVNGVGDDAAAEAAPTVDATAADTTTAETTEVNNYLFIILAAKRHK